MLSHMLKNLNSLLKGINYMLDGEGKAYIEFHYAEELSKNLNYDSIYHEHIFYFTYIALKNALIQNKLYPIDYFESPHKWWGDCSRDFKK